MSGNEDAKKLFDMIGNALGEFAEKQLGEFGEKFGGFFSDLPGATTPDPKPATDKPMPPGMLTPQVHYEKATVAFSEADDKRSEGIGANEVNVKMLEGVGQACLGILSALIRQK
jgi:hypothetical protein